MANNILQVTKQDQENVRGIVVNNGAVKGSRVRIVPTGTKFAKAFDVFVNGVLFANYYGVDSDTGLYSYRVISLTSPVTDSRKEA